MSNQDYYTTNLSYADGGSATAWRVVHRQDTGYLLMTPQGTKLCRIGNGCVYLWDKKEGREVQISLAALQGVCG